jgi:hypothetical protein
MNEKTAFAQRLTRLMKESGYAPKASVIEREFNQRYLGKPVTLQAVCRWLKGETIPTQDKLVVLAEWLKVDPHQLRYGKQLSARQIQDTRGNWSPVKSLTRRDMETWESFMKLPASQKKIIRETIEAFGKKTS